VSLGYEVEQVDVETPPMSIDTFAYERGPTSANRQDLRIFLLACHQASVSIESMSKYLGLDGDTIRSELLLGIEAWNAGQRRSQEAAAGPKVSS